MNKLIVCNWKMNGSNELIDAFANDSGRDDVLNAKVVICPPALFLSDAVSKAVGFSVGAQDCGRGESGAFTGDISAEMLSKVGVDYVIVGHSERRRYQRESNDVCAAKAKIAQEAGVIPIYCIGESRSDYEDGLTYSVLANQLESLVVHGVDFQNLVVAYEPVWAIGTGLVPDIETISKVMTDIQDWVVSAICTDDGADMCCLYGGSVTSVNSATILNLTGVGGVLVGGASLNVGEVFAIANNAAA